MGKTTLTDMQRIILSGAAMRLDHKVLPVPKSLQKGAAAIALSIGPLLTKGLVAEVTAEREDAVWREDPEAGRMAVVITSAGMEAIGVSPAEDAAPDQKPPSRLAGPEGEQGASTTPGRSSTNGRSPRDGSTLALLIERLGQSTGATIPEMIEATGWQAHSIRGAMSGALKKKLGLSIFSDMIEGRGRVYRLAVQEAPPAGAVAQSPQELPGADQQVDQHHVAETTEPGAA